jgi:hypothetical protein
MFNTDDRVYDVSNASHTYKVSDPLGRGAQGFVYKVQKINTNLM